MLTSSSESFSAVLVNSALVISRLLLAVSERERRRMLSSVTEGLKARMIRGMEDNYRLAGKLKFVGTPSQASFVSKVKEDWEGEFILQLFGQ